MKIVIIPSADLSYNSGSVIYAKRLFEFLLSQGHEVYILSSCIPDDICEEYKGYVKVKGHLLFHPIIDDRPIENLQHLKMGADILSALIEIYEEWGRIDIIHAHYASLNSYIPVLFRNFIGTTIVVSSFGRDLNIGYEISPLIRYFIDESYRNVDLIIVPDILLEEKIIRLFPFVRKEKIHVCPMPFDDRVLTAEKYTSHQANEVIFSTINSCFTQEKGIDSIIIAFSKVVENYGNCKLYIAGEDDDENKINYLRLKKLVATLEIEDKVFFTGFLSRQSVGSLLNCTDIFIDARRNGNFSSVLIEAEFKHKVIISSDNDAAKRIIIDGVNGVLFKNGDTNDLVQKIASLLRDEDRRAALINGTKEWCVSHGKEYTSETCMKKTIELYETAME